MRTGRRARRRVAGFSLVEFMIGLLVFTVGLTGVRSAQWLARQTGNEALQFMQANALATDMLTRVRMNTQALPGYVAAVALHSAGADDGPAPDCTVLDCAPPELARFDVAQWYGALHGRTVASAAPLGGLPEVSGCIGQAGVLFFVRILWRSRSGMQATPRPNCAGDGGVALIESLDVGWNQVTLTALVPP